MSSDKHLHSTCFTNNETSFVMEVAPMHKIKIKQNIFFGGFVRLAKCVQ